MTDFAPPGSFLKTATATSYYTPFTSPSTASSFAGPGAPATSLPGSPIDGQQAIYVDSTSAPTYAWLFQYSTAATKWLCLGGTPKYGASGMTVPLTAIYRVEIGVKDVTTGTQRNGNFTWTGGSLTLNGGGGVVSGTSATNYGFAGAVSGVTSSTLSSGAAITVTTSGSIGTVYVSAIPVTV